MGWPQPPSSKRLLDRFDHLGYPFKKGLGFANRIFSLPGKVSNSRGVQITNRADELEGEIYRTIFFMQFQPDIIHTQKIPFLLVTISAGHGSVFLNLENTSRRKRWAQMAVLTRVRKFGARSFDG